MVIGHRSSVIGHWALGIGHWASAKQVIGHWPNRSLVFSALYLQPSSDFPRTSSFFLQEC
ncbi:MULTISPECIES: hypothetical protein [unclassified Microcoleus]|uniref:hypothetical protein n=1 Tax=unclassified Microcoleus TaxID=2642155 RepID=UPI002FD39CB8